MFRLLGSALLLTGTVGYSFCFCMEMQERLNCLYEMKRMYELFYSQVGYCLADFPEACRMAEGLMKPPFSDMLRSVWEEAEQNTGRTFPHIWETQVEEYFPRFPLKKEDKALLAEFARSLGYADRELQKQAIDNQTAALLASIQKTETHLAERKKMVMSFGIMGGLLLIIILL